MGENGSKSCLRALNVQYIKNFYSPIIDNPNKTWPNLKKKIQIANKHMNKNIQLPQPSGKCKSKPQ